MNELRIIKRSDVMTDIFKKAVKELFYTFQEKTFLDKNNQLDIYERITNLIIKIKEIESEEQKQEQEQEQDQEQIQKQEEIEETKEEDSIEAKVEAYRRSLELEKEAKAKSEVS